MAGRRAIPTKLKKLKGTLRADRINPNEPEPELCLPDPPEWIDKIATDEYKRVGTELFTLGLMSGLDQAALAGYACSFSLLRQTTEAINREGVSVKRANGDIVPNPLLHVQYKAQQQMRLFLAEFGMTPATRTKVTARQETQKKENPFEEIAKQRKGGK